MIKTFMLCAGALTACANNGANGRSSQGYGINREDVDPELGQAQSFVGEPLVPAAGETVLIDRETGSQWNLRGEAFLGPMAQERRRLRMVPAHTAFWFAWSAFNHDSDVWTQQGLVVHANTTAIRGEPGCAVPCEEIVGGGPRKDDIPSLDHDNRVGTLNWVAADSSDASYLADDDMVLGVVAYDQAGMPRARAFSHNLLWWHEIANDRLAGRNYTVSYCPLTGSGLVFPGGADDFSFGTSGKLFNSNLVMYDRVTDSQWSQMWRTAITSSLKHAYLPLMPVTETTWRRWRSLWPETQVTGTATGFARDYRRYPYVRNGVDYRENHADTFRPTNPNYDRRYGAKEMVLGVRAGPVARAYPLVELKGLGNRAAINDSLGPLHLVVVWDHDGRLAIPFDRQSGDQLLTFDVVQKP